MVKPEEIETPVEEDLVFPYCGDCGHRFYQCEKVPTADAKAGPCSFCIQDQQEDERECRGY